MKKKIAIFTLPLYNFNYGGIFQNYALHQYLVKQFDAEVESIQFRFNPKFKLSQKIKITLHQIIFRNYYKFRRNVNTHLESFINSYIQKSPILNSHKQVESYLEKNKFDVLITGSDQVWRLDYGKLFYHLLFLNFPKLKNIKKLSYAASFGFEKWKFANYTEEIKAYLKDFDDISVREDTGVQILKNTFGISSQHLLDPTFLLDKEDYLKLIKSSGQKNTSGKVLYAYILDSNEEKNHLLKNIAKELNAELKTIELASDKVGKMDRKTFKNHLGLKSQSMEEWLNSFYQADYIITDSFHGTVFSIIFNKPFVALGNEKRGMSRFQSLLSLLGLKNRLCAVLEINEICELLNSPIDYENVEIKIQEERKKSYQYFKNHLI